jgi:hypothetical protein
MLQSNGNIGIGETSPSVPLHISTSATDPGLLVDGGSAGSAVAKFRRSEGIDPSAECFLNINFSDSDSQLRFEPTTETNRWSIGASNDDGNFEFAPNTKISDAAVIHFNRDGGIYSTAITASGDITASGGIRVGFGTFSGDVDTKTDAAIVIPEDKAIYTLDSSGQYLRNLIRKDSDVIKLGQDFTTLTDEIRLMPGSGGFTSFYGDTNGSSEVLRIDANGSITASSHISASGNIFGRQFEQHDMVMNGTIDENDTFLPFGGQSLSEQAVATNQNVQKIAAVDGRPRRVVIRGITPNTALGNLGYTCSYHQAVPGTGTAVHVASKIASSTGTNHESVTFDFTTGVDSGSYDDVLAGSRVYMSLTADSSISIGILGAVALWEWDYSSI